MFVQGMRARDTEGAIGKNVLRKRVFGTPEAVFEKMLMKAKRIA